MEFLTPIRLSKNKNNLIDYNSNLLLMGSCFSENIGAKLKYYKFNSVQNPFGILFHPKAIEIFITNAINQSKYKEEDVFNYKERWHCFDAHSSLSSPDKLELLDNLNKGIETTFYQLKKVSHIIITLGTAWTYREVSSDRLVANCHKVPQKKFLKELLSVNEISESLEAIIALIKTINSKVKFIFTVSPVRHLKDGFIENTQSKSHLIAGIHQVTHKADTLYFPSFEIMMDELRDYRFYKQDMIHPNPTAIDYIWEKFITQWFSESTIQIMKEVDSIQKKMAHKAFNPESREHIVFLKKIELQKQELKKKHPSIIF